MKIELNAYLLQPLAWVKCYCIKQASSYWSFLEAKNSLYLWLFLTSPPFNPLEKIIRQPLCCSTSTEKLECVRRSPQAFWTKHSGCTAMKRKNMIQKYVYKWASYFVQSHCCNDIFGSQNYWIYSEASGLGDLTGLKEVGPRVKMSVCCAWQVEWDDLARFVCMKRLFWTFGKKGMMV